MALAQRHGGRVAVCEILRMTGRVRDMILDPGQTHNIKTAMQEGDFYGMQTFDQSLLTLYEKGFVSLADAQLVASSPHDFRLLVQSHGSAPRRRCCAETRMNAIAHAMPVAV